MKSLKTIQTLSGIGQVLSKIVFVFSVIGFCGCVAGLLSSGFGNGSFLKIGGVTLHGLISGNLSYNIRSICAALSGWMIVCAGEAVLAKFAEIYFKNERTAGTPFTLSGAKEMLRLGILTLAIPTGCMVAGRTVEWVVAGFMKVEKAAVMDMCMDNAANIALGVMFLVAALLCRYGAELQESPEAK